MTSEISETDHVGGSILVYCKILRHRISQNSLICTSFGKEMQGFSLLTIN